MSHPMFSPSSRRTLLITVLLAGISGAALAERADRQQPVQLEADKVTVDDKTKLQQFEGTVHLTQGTLQIRAARLEVQQDAGGYQKGIAFGNGNAQAWFTQKREAREDYVEGQADRIEHDGKNEVTEFFGKAHVKSGLDEVTGPYIRYDGKSETYVVNSRPGTGAPLPSASGADRVRAVIQPKNVPPATPAPTVPAPKAP